eukprot:32014-Eustigmatos_ZCMA.PRE.1
MTEKYDDIGFSGPTLGSLTITERGLEWRNSVGTTKIVQVGPIPLSCVPMKVHEASGNASKTLCRLLVVRIRAKISRVLHGPSLESWATCGCF